MKRKIIYIVSIIGLLFICSITCLKLFDKQGISNNIKDLQQMFDKIHSFEEKEIEELFYGEKIFQDDMNELSSFSNNILVNIIKNGKYEIVSCNEKEKNDEDIVCELKIQNKDFSKALNTTSFQTEMFSYKEEFLNNIKQDPIMVSNTIFQKLLNYANENIEEQINVSFDLKNSKILLTKELRLLITGNIDGISNIE